MRIQTTIILEDYNQPDSGYSFTTFTDDDVPLQIRNEVCISFKQDGFYCKGSRVGDKYWREPTVYVYIDCCWWIKCFFKQIVLNKFQRFAELTKTESRTRIQDNLTDLYL